MFEKGDYIIYGNSGICEVEDITKLNFQRAKPNELYYVLNQLNTKGSQIYFPVNAEHTNIRKLMTEEEAWKLLDEIQLIEEIWVENEKQREEKYKKALNSVDYRQWVSIIKTLYQRRLSRTSEGKKIPAMDERYMKLAEDALYGELAFVLKKKKEDMVDFITSYVQKENGKE